MEPTPQTKPLFDSQNLGPEVTGIPSMTQEALHEEVQRYFIQEIPPDENLDVREMVNKVIRGQNQNTEVTIKVKHGIEHLHRKIKPMEVDLEALKEYRIGAEKIAHALVERNKIVDGYLKTISDAATWVKEKVGWWLVKLIQLFTIGLAYLLVDYIFTHLFHTPLPRSIAPSP